MNIENILQQITTLPPEGQKQVAYFITFLRERYQRTRSNKRSKKSKEGTFIGIWKNREDMQESTSWVRNIRQHEWIN